MKNILNAGVEANERRIDAFLAQEYPDYSRSFFKKLIENGGIKINGAGTKPDHKLKPGDRIEVEFPEIEPRTYGLIPLDVVYEDGEILVINKPAGICVHPVSANYFEESNVTILDILVGRYGKFSKGAEKEWNNRPYIVHRLDKDTSGVMVIAKTPRSQFDLMKQFSGRTVRKTYKGIACGMFSEKKGRIEAPLMNDYRRKKIKIGYGRKSVTTFSVVEKYPAHSLLEITPLTGRTHQIRVHLASINHPILGDKLYLDTSKFREEDYFPENLVARQMLHAFRLRIVNPATKKEMEFKAELPEDFNRVLEYLRKKN